VEEEGQQREQHAQALGASFEGRIDAGVYAVAPPRRARPPPGSYADTAHLSSKASPGSRTTNGRRDARGNTWAFTPRRKLRRALTASTSRTAVFPDP
jgi:hypothetical protein